MQGVYTSITLLLSCTLDFQKYQVIGINMGVRDCTISMEHGAGISGLGQSVVCLVPEHRVRGKNLGPTRGQK